MRALVTGAAGFIGSTLSARLMEDGWSVRGVDSFTAYYDPAIKRRNVAALLGRTGFEMLECDVRDVPVAALLGDVDVVFHQAAQPGVRASWATGFAAYDDANVRVTQHLLEAARERPVRRIVFASSSSVYGNPAEVPTHEAAVTRPYSPYGVTKLAGEHLCRAYGDNFGVPVTVLRYFTVYGPRQRPDMAIHRLIEAARRGTRFPLYGDGLQVRDFTFVDDVVAANIAAAGADLVPGETINVAGGSSTRLVELVDIIASAVGAPVAIEWNPAQPGDVLETGGACDRAAEMLGWKPQVSIEEGVARQVAWHRSALP
jgi:nucleoside-diphosphate-sugar epimerase